MPSRSSRRSSGSRSGASSLSRRFWLGAAVSFVGVGLVAVGAGSEVSGGYVGILLGHRDLRDVGRVLGGRRPTHGRLLTLARQRRCHPDDLGLIALTGIPQTSEQDWNVGWWIWALLVFATIGPLVLTNILWFRSISKIGPARATLAANLQPFVAAVLAVVLLSEPLGLLQVVGGLLIAAGILLARRRTIPAQAT